MNGECINLLLTVISVKIKCIYIIKISWKKFDFYLSERIMAAFIVLKFINLNIKLSYVIAFLKL